MPTTVVGYSTPDEVITALGAKGVDCKNPTPIALTDADRKYVEIATECSIDGELVSVGTFAGPQQRASYEAGGEQGNGGYPHWALGATWAVATLTRAKAEQIAAAIGGTPH